MLAVLALLAAASDSDSFRLHGGLSVGIGTTYDTMGIHAEIGTAHFGVFAGTGLMSGIIATDETGHSVSFGARWYDDVRSGWFVSANGTYSWARGISEGPFSGGGTTYLEDLLTLGAIGGYRWQANSVFFEIGAGALWFRTRDYGPTDRGWLPDLALGVGFDL